MIWLDTYLDVCCLFWCYMCKQEHILKIDHVFLQALKGSKIQVETSYCSQDPRDRFNSSHYSYRTHHHYRVMMLSILSMFVLYHTIIIILILKILTSSLVQIQFCSIKFEVLFYEAKLPFSERCIAIWKCHHPIELLRHSYHTLALSKVVYNFVFAQGAQKLPEIKVPMFVFP